MASCGFSKAQAPHFFCFQCWTCSARARSTIQPATVTCLIRPVTQLVQLRLSEARSPLTRVEKLFRLALGGFFPLLADGTFPPDIYGAHLDITLPNDSAFDVTGGEIGLFPNASQRWRDQFQIGDVPDSGCTLFLALSAVVLLFSLDAAIRRCPCSQRLLRP
jgi:hypothetical protein